MTPSAYRDHPIRQVLEQLLVLRDHQSMSADSVAGNEQYSAARDSVFAMADVLQELLEKTPASRVSAHALSQIHKFLNAAFNEVNAYTSNGNVNHLTNAQVQFEQNVLPWLWGFMPTVRGRESAKLRDLIESMSKKSQEAVQAVAKSRDALVAQLQELSGGVSKMQTRLEEMETSIAGERAQAAAAVSKLEQMFNAKEIERDTAFKAAIDEVIEKGESHREAVEQQSSDAIKYLEEKLAEAARIVQAVGAIGVTGNYRRIANEQQRLANIWRWITVGLFAAGIGLAMATFIRHFNETLNADSLWSIAIRLLYALVIAAPAWYTASESARHRTNADRARQTELELASLGPFIELLPEDKKNEIREQMTSHYFGKEVAPHEAKVPLDLDSLRKFIVDAGKAFKGG